MITIKLLEMIKPDRLMLEYLTYVISQKNIDIIELVKKLVKIWMKLKMDNDLVHNIVAQLNDLDNAHKYIMLSQKIEFYEELFGVDIYDMLKKYSNIYDLYQLFEKLESEHITIENLNNVLTSYLLDIQEKLESFTNENNESINILDYNIVNQVNENENYKYVCFIPEIDLALNGFSQGLYLFAGTLGSGKSSLLLNLAIGFNIFVNLYEDDLREKITNNLTPSVIYISVENTYTQTLLRIKAIFNDSSPIKIQENMTPLKRLHEIININKLIISNILYENATMTNIEKQIKQLINKGYHPTIIIVDYMDEIYITESIEHRHKLGLISRFLRNLALKYNSVVITATQLNRKAMEGKVTISNLSESIEHAKKADVIAMIVTGKTNLSNIKTCNYRILFENQNNKDDTINNPFKTIDKLQSYLPAMFILVQKNRHSLILNDIGVLSSPNSNIGFASLIECLNFDISAAITNLKSKYIENKPLLTSNIISKERLFINNVPDIYGQVGYRYEISKSHDFSKQKELQKIIESSRITYYEILKNLEKYKLSKTNNDDSIIQKNDDNDNDVMFDINDMDFDLNKFDETIDEL